MHILMGNTVVRLVLKTIILTKKANHVMVFQFPCGVFAVKIAHKQDVLGEVTAEILLSQHHPIFLI